MIDAKRADAGDAGPLLEVVSGEHLSDTTANISAQAILSTVAKSSPVYVASDIKRARRTKPEMAAIRDGIQSILADDHPQTVRQVFYALTVRGLIAKAEIEYQRTVVRLLSEMRQAGQVPFEWIADNTRWMRKPSSFTGIESCLTSAAHFYRRDL